MHKFINIQDCIINANVVEAIELDKFTISVYLLADGGNYEFKFDREFQAVDTFSRIKAALCI